MTKNPEPEPIIIILSSPGFGVVSVGFFSNFALCDLISSGHSLLAELGYDCPLKIETT